MMQGIIEDVIQALGWGLLKLVTFGAYPNDGPRSQLVEGAVGLATIAALIWVLYRLRPVI